MGLFDAITGRARKWLIGTALKKAAKRAVYASAGLLASQGFASLSGDTLTIDLTLAQDALIAGAVFSLAFIGNYMKVKWGVKGL